MCNKCFIEIICYNDILEFFKYLSIKCIHLFWVRHSYTKQNTNWQKQYTSKMPINQALVVVAQIFPKSISNTTCQSSVNPSISPSKTNGSVFCILIGHLFFSFCLECNGDIFACLFLYNMNRDDVIHVPTVDYKCLLKDDVNNA